jgi:curved DNA-binding protein
MEYKDYYKILGVNRKASADEIRSAYRKLAREFHPDVNPGAEDKFKEISEAWEVLGNAENRKKYDQLGANWKSYQDAPHWRDFYKGSNENRGERASYRSANADDFARNDGRGFFDGFGFSDFFKTFFGKDDEVSDANVYDATRGKDLQASLTVSFADAYKGTTKNINVQERTVAVPIKPGIRDGHRLRFAGKGGKAPTASGTPGDLTVVVHVRPDERFERDGNDLRTEQTVDVFTAVLGGELRVETPGGPVKMKLAPGAQNGSTLRLRAKGMPVYGKPGEFGNLFVTLNVQIPTELTPQQREMWEYLRGMSVKSAEEMKK